MKKKRPVNLDLRTIQMPVTAIVSILHRISGIITFVTIGIFLWLLSISLSSQEGFMQATIILSHPVVKFIFWIILTVLAYHLCGGIRHLLMDFNYIKEDLVTGIRSAQVIIILTLMLSILVGVLLW